MKYTTGLQIDHGPLWVIIVVSFLWLLSSIWIVRDALKRGKNPVVMFAFCTIAGWPLSVLWWLYLRPQVMNENGAEQVKRA